MPIYNSSGSIVEVEEAASKPDDLRRDSERRRTIQSLRERRAELRHRAETGALRIENEALESQVLEMQEVFVSLQEDFKDMKDRFGARLDALKRALEDQHSITIAAEKRVICSEDLVRFQEEQRRLMAGHWKGVCQRKDEKIRGLNKQLNEFTIEWQQLGTQKQTEASLSHEFHCLQDRHTELKMWFAERDEQARTAEASLEAAHREEAELREAIAAAEASADAAAADGGRSLAADASREADALRAETAEVRAELELARAWRSSEESAVAALRAGSECIEASVGEERSAPKSLVSSKAHQVAAPESQLPWPHRCIWRDELDVRERQLEKIATQLDRTSGALQRAKRALAAQKERHEEIKGEHRHAEAALREEERKRAATQRQCLDLQRKEAQLRRSAEMEPRPRSSAQLRRGLLSHDGDAKAAGAEDRLAAIFRETRRIVEVRREGAQVAASAMAAEARAESILAKAAAVAAEMTAAPPSPDAGAPVSGASA